MLISLGVNSQRMAQEKKENVAAYQKAFVNFNDYEKLMQKVKVVRANRLIDFNKLLDYKLDTITVLLDARSRKDFNALHLKGAINLPFTEFTQDNLRKLIPNIHTRIIIYCNNNFLDEPVLFASKVFVPHVSKLIDSGKKDDELMLALNIPTYLNLYGYGYRNIYELDELLSKRDPRVVFEGDRIVSINRLN